MAIYLGIVIFIITLMLCAFILFAGGMSDEPDNPEGNTALLTFLAGTVIAVLVFASHWLPHIGW